MTIDRTFLARSGRRTFISAGATLGVWLVVAACGDDDDDGDAADASIAAPAATGEGMTSAGSVGASTAGGFPLTMEHVFGTTTIPAQPQRVVTAGFNDVDVALAVGVVPLGVADFIGTYDEAERPWAQDALAGAEPELVTNDAGELLPERIAALNPDVIVYYNDLRDVDDEVLSQIAPTVVEPEVGTLWPQHTIDVGRAFGREAEAQAMIDEVEARVAEERAAHPEFEGTVAAILFGVATGTNYYLLEPTDSRVGLFVSLGFEMPETTGEIAGENAALLDQDVIGMTQEELEADPVFSGLTAVQEGRVAYLGGFDEEFAGALGFDSPLSLPAALDIAVPELARALAPS